MREGCLLRLVVKLVSGVGYRYLSSSTFFPAANGTGSSAASARISSCTLWCNSVADRDGYITGLLCARLMRLNVYRNWPYHHRLHDTYRVPWQHPHGLQQAYRSCFVRTLRLGEKFGNFMELYNVMELYVFPNELHILGYKPTVPPRQ